MRDPSSPSPDPARAYATIRYRLMVANLVLSIAILAGIQWSGASHTIAAWWAARWAQPALALLGYLLIVGALYYLANLPMHFYRSYVLEHRFGLSRMRLTQWWVREAKQLAMITVLNGVLFSGLYALLRHQPHTWPVWATVGWVGFTVVLARVFPTMVIPLFYTTTPLQDEGLVKRLLLLCKRVDLSVLGVFTIGLGAETRKANAALVGLGKSRRVLLADTLLEQFTPEEIEGVLAHELAHHRYRHMLKLLGLSAVGSALAFWLTQQVSGVWIGALGLSGLSDPAGVPVLMLWFSFLSLLALPVQNGCSRAFEWQADRFAVDMTRANVFAAALERLATINLADPNPPGWVEWMFYDHPSITRRIAAARVATSPS